MPDEPDRPRDDPARSWDDEAVSTNEGHEPTDAEPIDEGGPQDTETVGTGSYVAVSCVAAMGLLLVVLIVGLMISRWIG